MWEPQEGHLRVESVGDEVARKATATPEKSAEHPVVKPASSPRAHESAEVSQLYSQVWMYMIFLRKGAVSFYQGHKGSLTQKGKKHC